MKIKTSVFLFFCLLISFSKINAQGSCPNPIALGAVNTTPTSAEFVWNSTGTETQWEIIIQMDGAAAPGNNVSGETVSTMSYYADFLIPLTGYDVYVRAICSSTEQSSWVGPFHYYYYPPVANDDCSSPTVLTVNSNNQCTQSTVAVFLGSTVSSESNYCGNNNDGDVWFKFTATSAVHVVELSNFSGSALPIVLTIYSGASCNSLQQINCSSVNHITATGLVAGTDYLIRASINAINTTKDVTFSICVNTPNLSGNNNSQQCLINTINSNFEHPNFSSNSVNFINHHAMQGWRTTASDGIIEVWNNFQNIPAYSGNQFIELNANEASGVYQDFDTPVTTTFSFGFAHRGRQGMDVCGLYAGPPGGPYQLIFTATTGNSAWNYYTGTYVVPEGQTETRFKFEAISANGGITVGNFLDDIRFTANNGILSQNPMVLDCSINVATMILASGSGTWSVHSDNPSPTTIDDVSLNAPTISGFSEPGIYQYTWTTLYCSDTLLVEFFGGTIAPPVVADVNYCQNASAVPLTAITSEDYTLNWYANATGGAPLAEAPIPTTSSTGTTTYYVSQSTGSLTCESPRVPLKVTIIEPDAVVVDLNYEFSEYCISETTIYPVTAIPSNGVYTATGPLEIDSLTGAINLENIIAGNYTITYTIPANTENCIAEGTTSFNLILIESSVPQADFYYPNTFCYNDENALPTVADGFVYGGVFEAEMGLSINASTGEINVKESNPGTYTITYFIPENPANCQSSGTGTAIVVINQQSNFTIKGECLARNFWLIVEGDSNENRSYSWTDQTGNSIGTGDDRLNVTEYLLQNPTVIPADGLPFWVNILENGCEYKIEYKVNSTFCGIPKGISPNGDAQNDSFDLTGLGVKKLIIHNRYGTVVYEHKNYTNQWFGQSNKGDELPDGTYFYYIETNDNQNSTGWVYINR